MSPTKSSAKGRSFPAHSQRPERHVGHAVGQGRGHAGLDGFDKAFAVLAAVLDSTASGVDDPLQGPGLGVEILGGVQMTQYGLVFLDQVAVNIIGVDIRAALIRHAHDPTEIVVGEGDTLRRIRVRNVRQPVERVVRVAHGHAVVCGVH